MPADPAAEMGLDADKVRRYTEAVERLNQLEDRAQGYSKDLVEQAKDAQRKHKAALESKDGFTPAQAVSLGSRRRASLPRRTPCMQRMTPSAARRAMATLPRMALTDAGGSARARCFVDVSWAGFKFHTHGPSWAMRARLRIAVAMEANAKI